MATAKSNRSKPAKRPFDIEEAIRLLREAVAPYPKAALFELAGDGFTSVFTMTGANMSVGPNARRENRELFEAAPVIARKLRPLLILQHRARRMLGGMYFQKPFDYEIFTLKSPDQRQRFHVNRPTGVHKETAPHK